MKRAASIFFLATVLIATSCSKDEVIFNEPVDLLHYDFVGTIHKSECGEYDIIVSDTTGLHQAVDFDSSELPRFSEYNLDLPSELDGQTIYFNMRSVAESEAWACHLNVEKYRQVFVTDYVVAD